MDIFQNKQVAVNLGWELKRIGKLIAKINGSRKSPKKKLPKKNKENKEKELKDLSSFFIKQPRFP